MASTKHASPDVSKVFFLPYMADPSQVRALIRIFLALPNGTMRYTTLNAYAHNGRILLWNSKNHHRMATISNLVLIARICEQKGVELKIRTPGALTRKIFEFNTVGQLDKFLRNVEPARKHLRKIRIVGPHACDPVLYDRKFWSIWPATDLESMVFNHECVEEASSPSGRNLNATCGKVTLADFFEMVKHFLHEWYKINQSKPAASTRVLELFKFEDVNFSQAGVRRAAELTRALKRKVKHELGLA